MIITTDSPITVGSAPLFVLTPTQNSGASFNVAGATVKFWLKDPYKYTHGPFDPSWDATLLKWAYRVPVGIINMASAFWFYAWKVTASPIVAPSKWIQFEVFASPG